MKVFVHTKKGKKDNWTNQPVDFVKLPQVGEYIALSSSAEWCEVVVVVHCPFPAVYEAEIYAIEVDHHKVLSKFSERPVEDTQIRFW